MTVVGTSTKLRCVSIIFYSLDGYGLANPYLHVDSELIDPQRCTEIDAYHIDPSRPIVDLDGHELTEQVVLKSGGYYADNDGEYEFGIAVEPGTSIEQAVLHVLNNPLEFAIPSTSRFVGWCSRPTTSNMTMVQL